MANPLPATSTATTRTHNQPQPQLPSGKVAMAALQNDCDDPHLAGKEACRCSLCHITDRFFPRSQDGRIVFPHPIISVHSHSMRLHRPAVTIHLWHLQPYQHTEEIGLTALLQTVILSGEAGFLNPYILYTMVELEFIYW